MTEIPEHLLKRARERREALGIPGSHLLPPRVPDPRIPQHLLDRAAAAKNRVYGVNPASTKEPEPRWDREDLQRVLYEVVLKYIASGGKDDELLRNAIFQVAIPTLKDNNWWPHDGGWEIVAFAAAQLGLNQQEEPEEEVEVETNLRWLKKLFGR